MNETEKWIWMMDYCRKNGLAPGDSHNWELAEKAFQEEHKCAD